MNILQTTSVFVNLSLGQLSKFTNVNLLSHNKNCLEKSFRKTLFLPFFFCISTGKLLNHGFCPKPNIQCNCVTSNPCEKKIFQSTFFQKFCSWLFSSEISVFLGFFWSFSHVFCFFLKSVFSTLRTIWKGTRYTFCFFGQCKSTSKIGLKYQTSSSSVFRYLQIWHQNVVNFVTYQEPKIGLSEGVLFVIFRN